MEKTCKECNQTLPIESFYNHPETKDRRFAKCKTCVKGAYASRPKKLFQIPQEWRDNPLEWKKHRNKRVIELAKARGKYPAKCSPEARRRATKRFAARWPEKIAAHNACKKIPKQPGYELHHWSYNVEHKLDTILISKVDHYRIAKFIEYVPERRMYKRKDTGQLLDTKELHEAYIREVISGHKIATAGSRSESECGHTQP
jgi:hypothetical protein